MKIINRSQELLQILFKILFIFTISPPLLVAKLLFISIAFLNEDRILLPFLPFLLPVAGFLDFQNFRIREHGKSFFCNEKDKHFVIDILKFTNLETGIQKFGKELK